MNRLSQRVLFRTVHHKSFYLKTMHMKTMIKVLAAVTLLMIFLLLSCNKEKSVNTGRQKISIYLTDNPIDFKAVNIDIQRIEVKVEIDSAGIEREFWHELQIRPGVYNILNFRNGVDTLIAQGYIPGGEIKKLRITLGTRNSVVIDTTTYPLLLKEPFVIIDLDDDLEEINPAEFKLMLDFDACGSIIRINNNQFELRPRIRTFSDDDDGRIEGTIMPKEARAIVSVKSGTQTLLAIPDEDDGEFKIRGIKTGVVDLFVDATANGYRDTTIRNIIVGDRDVKLGTIVLKK